MTSIIIPTYNSGQFLAWTVDSIRAQTLNAWELLLVDDGSTDDTLVRAREWAADDSRISVLRQQHGGPNRARNLGFDACDPASKAVIFLDHEDVWEKDALTSLQAALDTHPRAAAAYGIAYHIDTNGAEYDAGLEAWTRNRLAVNGKRVERVPADIATTFEVLAIGNRIPTPGQVLIRRSALGQAGLWDASTAAA